MVILSYVKIQTIDYGVLLLIIVRCLVTMMLFRLISEGRSGFETNDIKQLHDSIVFIFIPVMPVGSVNFKIDILLTTPLVLVSQFIVSKMAFSTDSNNMDCFATPESFGAH